MTIRGSLLALSALCLAPTLGPAACAEPAAQKAERPIEAAQAGPVSTPPAAQAPPVARLFGHFPYAEGAGLQAGVCVHGDPERTRLKPDAAEALGRMRAAARAEGVTLQPASCFRSIESQRRLFNCSGASGTGCVNGQLASPERRATAVAPPGHSEHATGYAIDFFPSASDMGADGGCPTRAACTLTARFAQSRSGRWLAAHAHEYGFEQSFYEGSAQGVIIEPWHYRFVGSEEAEAVFRAARAQFPPPRPGRRQ